MYASMSVCIVSWSTVSELDFDALVQDAELHFTNIPGLLCAFFYASGMVMDFSNVSIAVTVLAVALIPVLFLAGFNPFHWSDETITILKYVGFVGLGIGGIVSAVALALDKPGFK